MKRSRSIERDGVLVGGVLPPGIEPDGTRTVEPVEGVSIAVPTFAAGTIDALLHRLRDASRTLRERPMRERIEVLGRAGERLQDPGDPTRAEALRLLPRHARLSAAGAVDVLDAMAADWTRPRLRQLVEREFPEAPPEDRFGPPAEDPDGRPTRTSTGAPDLIVTICSGTVPGVSVTAAIRSLLVGAGTLLKPGGGDAVLPLLFASVLQEIDPEMAAALAVAYWPGGDSSLEDRALAEAGRIVVYGGDDTIRSVRSRASAAASLVEYRHRVGVAVAGVSGLAEPDLDDLAEAVTDAVVPYEQRGCVSPVRIYAVGSADDVRRFGERLAGVLEQRENWIPGERTPEEAASAHQLAGALELRRAAGHPIDLWSTPQWMVAVEPSGDLFAGGRVVLISAVEAIDEVCERLTELTGRLQVVGVGGLTEAEEERIATVAARAGASRVGPLRGVAYPPPWWLHEGRGPLRALVDQTEWARGGS